MNISRYQGNFDRLCKNLAVYAQANCPPPVAGEERGRRAKALSRSLFLAHSTASKKFGNICSEGRLKSSKGWVDQKMGTAGSVFFYLSPFRYPHTDCGLLFSRTLESTHPGDGVATPFDSGGLWKHCVRPDPAQTPQQFLADHELPIPDHREYLSLCMSTLFGEPKHYVEGNDPRWPGPIGLTGGDERRWTHEVRIKGQVPLRDGHLQAVFAPQALVASVSDIRGLFEWCETAGVDAVAMKTTGEPFLTLQRECLAYIGSQLY